MLLCFVLCPSQRVIQHAATLLLGLVSVYLSCEVVCACTSLPVFHTCQFSQGNSMRCTDRSAARAAGSQRTANRSSMLYYDTHIAAGLGAFQFMRRQEHLPTLQYTCFIVPEDALLQRSRLLQLAAPLTRP